MSQENKDSCCSKPATCCSNPRKLILAVLFGGFMFMAGMMFSKAFCGSGSVCPMSSGK